jgi:hypothetical protein
LFGTIVRVLKANRLHTYGLIPPARLSQTNVMQPLLLFYRGNSNEGKNCVIEAVFQIIGGVAHTR